MASFEEREPTKIEEMVGMTATSKQRNAGDRYRENDQNDPELRNSTTKRKSEKLKPSRAIPSKSDAVLRLLRSAKGATVEAMMQATEWQAH